MEHDVLLCPKCEDQLCEGETDLKKQIWVVKACGHVYCGECTANRATKAPSKGKRKQPVAQVNEGFRGCVVEGCNAKTTGKTGMFQLFI
jgi:hypothetical protein